MRERERGAPPPLSMAPSSSHYKPASPTLHPQTTMCARSFDRSFTATLAGAPPPPPTSSSWRWRRPLSPPFTLLSGAAGPCTPSPPFPADQSSPMSTSSPHVSHRNRATPPPGKRLHPAPAHDRRSSIPAINTSTTPRRTDLPLHPLTTMFAAAVSSIFSPSIRTGSAPSPSLHRSPQDPPSSPISPTSSHGAHLRRTTPRTSTTRPSAPSAYTPRHRPLPPSPALQPSVPPTFPHGWKSPLLTSDLRNPPCLPRRRPRRRRLNRHLACSNPSPRRAPVIHPRPELHTSRRQLSRHRYCRFATFTHPCQNP